MYIFWIILHTLITNGLEIVIFFKVDGINLTFERIFKAFLLKILLAFVFVMISYIVGNVYLSYFMEPLYGIGLSFLLLRGLPKKLLFFYGLFPMILVIEESPILCFHFWDKGKYMMATHLLGYV